MSRGQGSNPVEQAPFDLMFDRSVRSFPAPGRPRRTPPPPGPPPPPPPLPRGATRPRRSTGRRWVRPTPGTPVHPRRRRGYPGREGGRRCRGRSRASPASAGGGAGRAACGWVGVGGDTLTKTPDETRGQQQRLCGVTGANRQTPLDETHPGGDKTKVKALGVATPWTLRPHPAIRGSATALGQTSARVVSKSKRRRSDLRWYCCAARVLSVSLCPWERRRRGSAVREHSGLPKWHAKTQHGGTTQSTTRPGERRHGVLHHHLGSRVEHLPSDRLCERRNGRARRLLHALDAARGNTGGWEEEVRRGNRRQRAAAFWRQRRSGERGRGGPARKCADGRKDSRRSKEWGP